MSIGRKITLGAVWTIATSLLSRSVGLCGTLILTRFVAPHVYGEVMVAHVLALTASQLSDVGLGQYVAAKPGAGRAVTFHATFYHVLLGALALGVLLSLRHALVPLFDAPGAARYLPGLAMVVLIERVSLLPERVLMREMRFRAVAVPRMIGDLTYSLVSVSLAAAGLGGEAIVLGNIARALLYALLLIRRVERREWLEPCRIDTAHTRELFRFGLPLAIGGVAGFVVRRWDRLLLARFFGPHTAALYNLSYNLAAVPSKQVGEKLAEVLLPGFAHMARDQRAGALTRSLALLSLVVSPLAVGLGAVAPTLTAVVFDDRWAEVGAMLPILAGIAVPRSVTWMVSSFLQANDRTRDVMLLELLRMAAVLGGIASFGRIGPSWLCAAVLAGLAIDAAASLWVAHRLSPLPGARVAAGILMPLVASVPMVAVVMGVRHVLQAAGVAAQVPALLAEVTAGAAVFVASALLLQPATSRELLLRLRWAVDRRSARG